MTISKSVIRAAEILKVLAAGEDRLTSISQELNLNKSTVYRLLNALEKTGLVAQDAITHRYYLGNLFLSFASTPEITHRSLLSCAREELEHLRNTTKETVGLHVPIGTQRLCVEELQSPQPIRFIAGRGHLAPIYTGAAGKILLQSLSEAELGRLLKRVKLIPIGPNTITSEKKLIVELEKVRKRGYATSSGERVAGSASVSVLVTGYITPVALSVIGPENRIAMQKHIIVRNLRTSARRISQKLKASPVNL